MGIDKNNLKYSVYDVISSDITAEEAILESELIKNLYLIPSTMQLAGAEVELINKKDKEVILREKLEPIKDKFDYIFIDCPPSLGFLTINALSACNSVFIPIQCEFYALEGVGQLVNTIQLVKKSLNKDIEIEGILMSMYDSRIRLGNEVVSEVRKFFKDKVYDTTIPRNIRLAEAPSYGLPIALYDNKCRGASSYEDLAKEFIKRQGGDSVG